MNHLALARRENRERLDSLVEASLAELRSFQPTPRRAFEADSNFGSPATGPRPVRASFVSCQPPSAAIAAITGPDPVSSIQAANTRAIELLDYVIRDLEGKRDEIRAGRPTADVVEDLPTRDALQRRFRMNADDRSIWTSSGARSIRSLIRRLRGARQILADGWMRYVCVGLPTIDFTLGGRRCRSDPNDGCVGDTVAAACPGVSQIVLCRPFWRDADNNVRSLDFRASTLLHEALHIYFGFIADQGTGNFANAHCYEQFVLDMNWVDVPGEFVGSCP